MEKPKTTKIKDFTIIDDGKSLLIKDVNNVAEVRLNAGTRPHGQLLYFLENNNKEEIYIMLIALFYATSQILCNVDFCQRVFEAFEKQLDTSVSNMETDLDREQEKEDLAYVKKITDEESKENTKKA
jgi:hypothetical protein